VLGKLQDDAVERPKLREPTLTFKFPECSRLAPPVLPFDEVSFAYSGQEQDYLYDKVPSTACRLPQRRILGILGTYTYLL
jgi:hypothetical protein